MHTYSADTFSTDWHTGSANQNVPLTLEKRQALEGLQPCTSVIEEALAKAHVAETNNSSEHAEVPNT